MRHRQEGSLVEPQDCIGRVPYCKGINICLSRFLRPIKYIRGKKAATFKP